MVIIPILGAFFAGLGFIGLQSLFLEKMVLLCDLPSTALFIHFYLLLITILVASYIIDARPAKNPERIMRINGLAIIISHGTAYFLLSWIVHPSLSTMTAAWLGGVILTVPAVTAGMAFGWFFQVVLKFYSGKALLILCSAAAGALIAGPRARILTIELGSTLAFVLILSAFVAILAILPSTASDDRSGAKLS